MIVVRFAWVMTYYGLARWAALKAAIAALENDGTPAAQRLKLEYEAAPEHARRGQDPHETQDNALRRQVLTRSRRALDDLA